MNILLKLLEFLAGIGVFLFAMKTLSQGLEKSAGSSIRKLFAKISGNRLVGVGVGAGVTVLMQSSAATTVMILGFVNAGLMSLFQATSMIMGANIGTTLTAILISLKTLSIARFFQAFTAVGAFIVLFAKKEKLRAIGALISGIGLIFIGLEIMTSGMNFLAGSTAFQAFITRYNNPFLVLLMGIVFTAAIQSSTAMTGIIITLVSLQGGSVISLPTAFYLIMGANIGTCVTALLASIGAGVNTKRTAFIHLVFNLIGVMIFFPLIAIAGNGFTRIFTTIFGTNMAASIAFFHIGLNLITTLLLLPFIAGLVALAETAIADKGPEKGKKQLRYLDERILTTPSLAITQIVKETISMQKEAFANFQLAVKGLLEGSSKEREALLAREEYIDYLNHAISAYMVKVGSLNITARDESLLGKLFHIINDIERIGDHAENLSNYTEEMLQQDISFSPIALEETKAMSKQVEEMFELTLSAFSLSGVAKLKTIKDKLAKIEEMKEQYTSEHIKRLGEGICKVDSGAIFFSALNDFKRIADHLINIASRIDPAYDIIFKRVLRKASITRAESIQDAKRV